MLRKKVLWLVSWLAIVAWVISACGPILTPPAGEAVSGPTPVEEHEAEHQREAEHEHEHEAEHEAEMVELEPVSLAPGEKLRVVATTNIVAHIVSQVGGDAIHLTGLLPIGADPHTYVARPQDIVAVADADVIFANGADLEVDFLPDLTRDTKAPVVYVSNGVELREFGRGDEHEAEHESQEGHRHEGIDPHTWTTPSNVIVFVHNIKHALSALDAAHAETYAANAEIYEAKLEALDEWVRAQIETVPTENRELVTDHTSFGYYTDRYGLEQIGSVIPSFITGAEPSAQELAALEDAIREHGIRAVFVGTTVNPDLSKRVAEDTGTQLVTIYHGSLGPEGSGVETYVAYTCYNTLAIVEALGGTPDVAGSPCE
jgi:ABC-type Zn uptake system ZnuABC Zn-binding protein ZnuA